MTRRRRTPEQREAKRRRREQRRADAALPPVAPIVSDHAPRESDPLLVRPIDMQFSRHEAAVQALYAIRRLTRGGAGSHTLPDSEPKPAGALPANPAPPPASTE